MAAAPGLYRPGRIVRPSRAIAPILVAVATILWIATFAVLALVRDANGGTHAEDLGFTDQVIWNFLRGQWFRTSIYQGATWNTEFDVTRLARTDSLLAFHVEPMLAAFAPLYALGGDGRSLLVLQAVALGLGAVPAYWLGHGLAGTAWAGAVAAAAYLLSPLGQWAVLADFHTTVVAAPLLLLAMERIVSGRTRAGVFAAAGALTAREDVGLTVAAVGLMLALTGRRRPGLTLLALGAGWTVLCLEVIRAYSGGEHPLAARFAGTFGSPMAILLALRRPEVGEYARVMLLAGGWLSILAPLSILSTAPVALLNALSASPWMASGKAHYSALVLPMLTAATAAGLGQVAAWQRSGQRQWRVSPVALACIALVATSGLAYVRAGAGPFGGDYTPPAGSTRHAALRDAVATSIPPDASVSASSSLIPHIGHRARLYVFPAVQDADLVFVDVTTSPAPTSVGDVYLHVRTLLGGGGWKVERAEDGLLLLQRADGAAPQSADDLAPAFYSFVQDSESAPGLPLGPQALPSQRPLELLSSTVVPSPDETLEPDGPRGVLRTAWRVMAPVRYDNLPDLESPSGDGFSLPGWENAPALWWYPPNRWQPGEIVRVDLPGVLARYGWSDNAVADLVAEEPAGLQRAGPESPGDATLPGSAGPIVGQRRGRGRLPRRSGKEGCP